MFLWLASKSGYSHMARITGLQYTLTYRLTDYMWVYIQVLWVLDLIRHEKSIECWKCQEDIPEEVKDDLGCIGSFGVST